MKAAFLSAIRKFDIRDVADPTISAPDEVLLRVDRVGVCGSDMHYYKDGRIGARQVVAFPWLLGHECACTVVQTGTGVTDLAVGRRVALDPLVACGQCDQCRRGREHTCRNQRFLGCPGQIPGAMAELLVMPRRCCHAIPDSMTMDQAVIVEPFAIGLWAAKLAGAGPGAKIVILGAGPVGLCVLAALKAGGVRDVLAVDLLAERLAVARKLGAGRTHNASQGDTVEALAAIEPEGVDFVFECAGRQETISQGVELLRPGGMLLIAGIPEPDEIVLEMSRMRRKELTIRNVRRQNGCEQLAIDMVADGRVNLDPLVTHHFALEQSQAAFDLVADYRDGVIKAMICMGP